MTVWNLGSTIIPRRKDCQPRSKWDVVIDIRTQHDDMLAQPDWAQLLNAQATLTQAQR